MSAEVVAKKRGRPRKIVSEALEGEIAAPAPVKPTKSKSTSTKSTTTRIRKAKTPTSTVPDISIAESAKPEPAIDNTFPTTSTASSIPSSPESQKGRTKTTVTPKTSKILEQVRELSTKASMQSPNKKTLPGAPSASAAAPAHTVKPEPLKASQSPPKPIDTAIPASPVQPTTVSPQSSSSKTPTQPPNKNIPPPSKPKVPLAAFNSAIVSNISERAGARPNTSGSKALPKNYQSTARRVTMTIVALPIAIVTSYVLYQRLVLGEQKSLLVPQPKDVAPSANVVLKDE